MFILCLICACLFSVLIGYLFGWIMKKLGYVPCRWCGKWTKPSYIEGNICSSLCWNLENINERLDHIESFLQLEK